MVMSSSPQWAYLIVWEFQVRAGAEKDFERVYGPSGDWAQLFQTGAGYVATELNRDLKVAGRYFTLDFWSSRDAYERFRQTHAGEYAALDVACERLTSKEASLGDFERVVAISGP